MRSIALFINIATFKLTPEYAELAQTRRPEGGKSTHGPYHEFQNCHETYERGHTLASA
jgi:hypothetical protein